MIRGYVSSDEDDYYDDMYSEPLFNRERKSPPLPEIQNKDLKLKLDAALEHNKKIELFMKAIDDGDLEVLEELISLGVPVDDAGSQKWTGLMKACGMGKFEIVQFLLEHGSNPSHQKELFTPLMVCCTYTLTSEDLKLNCVRLLLEYGADVNATDKYNTTCLMYACGSGYSKIVTELLAVPGINVNLQDKEGWTALFYAVTDNYTEIVEKLLSVGADLDLIDRNQRTVLNVALDKNLMDMAKLLGYEEKASEVQKVESFPGQRFLDELPLPNGEGGFPSDAQNILALFNQHKVKEVNLPDLLNMTENDLKEIGVKLKHDRRKILSRGIHRYHLQPWTKFSLPEIVQGSTMSMEDAIALTGSIAKHLTIANASLRYLKSRIASRKNKPEDSQNEKSLIFTLVMMYNTANSLQGCLTSILGNIDQIKPEISADLICKYNNSKGRTRKYFWYTVCTAVTAGFLVHCLKRGIWVVRLTH